MPLFSPATVNSQYQIIALANVNADGTTVFAFGCTITYISGGTYDITIPTAISNDRCFVFLTLKSSTLRGSVSWKLADSTDTVKRVETRGDIIGNKDFTVMIVAML